MAKKKEQKMIYETLQHFKYSQCDTGENVNRNLYILHCSDKKRHKFTNLRQQRW
jgi:hypothetical protein